MCFVLYKILYFYSHDTAWFMQFKWLKLEYSVFFVYHEYIKFVCWVSNAKNYLKFYLAKILKTVKHNIEVLMKYYPVKICSWLTLCFVTKNDLTWFTEQVGSKEKINGLVQ